MKVTTRSKRNPNKNISMKTFWWNICMFSLRQGLKVYCRHNTILIKTRSSRFIRSFCTCWQTFFCRLTHMDTQKICASQKKQLMHKTHSISVHYLTWTLQNCCLKHKHCLVLSPRPIPTQDLLAHTDHLFNTLSTGRCLSIHTHENKLMSETSHSRISDMICACIFQAW